MKEDFIPLTHEQESDLIDFMVETNKPEFNYNKAVEEATEFTDALVKHQTKHPDNPNRPKRKDVVNEYADFMYRGLLALLTLYKGEKNENQIGEMIEEHIRYKFSKLQSYKDKGLYINGL